MESTQLSQCSGESGHPQLFGIIQTKKIGLSIENTYNVMPSLMIMLGFPRFTFKPSLSKFSDSLKLFSCKLNPQYTTSH